MKDQIQSVIFDKTYWTLPSSRKWLQDHNLRFNNVRKTNKFIRFRQIDPDYERFYYETKRLKNHIALIIGFPLKSGKGKITLSEAKEAANKIIKKFNDHGIKLHIVGSLKRNQTNVNDLDFITTDPLPDNRKYLKFSIDGIQIDIWRVKSLAVAKAIRTYPRHVIIALRNGLIKKGYKLTDSELLKGNKKIEIKNPREIFDLAEIEYRPFHGKK